MKFNKEMIRISYEEATTPTEGAIVMMNRWWTAYKEGHISVYTADTQPNKITGLYQVYSPQCNSNKHIASYRSKRKAVFLPIIYFKNRLAKGEQEWVK